MANDELPQPPIRKVDLWKHQRAVYHWAMPKPAALIAAGLGCGKSLMAIALTENRQCNRSLCLAPKSVMAVWNREWKCYGVRPTEVLILSKGSLANRVERAEKAWQRAGQDDNLVLVANYEAAIRSPMREWLLSKHFSCIVLDEAHKVCGDSATSQCAADLRTRAEYRIACTATPLTQNPTSVWGQCRFLDPSIFGESFEHFLDYYTNTEALRDHKESKRCHETLARLTREYLGREPEASPTFTVRPWHADGTVHTEEFLQRLSSIAYRVENDVLDLPPLVEQVRTFRLSAKARAAYDAIKSGYEVEIATGQWADVSSSYSVVMRLQEITSGWLPDTLGNIVTLDKGKEELLRGLLEEAAGEPVVVFCRFIRDLDAVQRAAESLGLRYGEISHRRKDGIDDMAQMPDGLQVVGVQQQAGGAGIDLSRSRIAIGYSWSWSLAEFKQSIGRVYRPPQSRSVAVYHLVAEDTIDEEIRRAIFARDTIIRRTWKAMETVVTLRHPHEPGDREDSAATSVCLPR